MLDVLALHSKCFLRFSDYLILNNISTLVAIIEICLK